MLQETGVRRRWGASVAVIPQISGRRLHAAGHIDASVACHHAPSLLRMLLMLLLLQLLLLLLVQGVEGAAELVLMMLGRQTGQLGMLLLQLTVHPRQHNSLCAFANAFVFAVSVATVSKWRLSKRWILKWETVKGWGRHGGGAEQKQTRTAHN